MFSQGALPVSPAERDQVIETFRKISRLYPDMVLVPGTIRSGEHRKSKAGTWKNIRNTAFAVWNGQLMHTHDKLGNAGDTTVEGENNAKGWAKNKESTKSPLFTIGNLQFAIDICADHSTTPGRAKAATQKSGRKTDVHLVTSAGTSMTAESSATGEGTGFAMGADIETNGARGFRGPKAVEGTVLTGSATTKQNKGKPTVLTYFPPAPRLIRGARLTPRSPSDRTHRARPN